MDLNKYKRDYKYKSSEGANEGLNKWIIIIGGLIVALLAYFLK